MEARRTGGLASRVLAAASEPRFCGGLNSGHSCLCTRDPHGHDSTLPKSTGLGDAMGNSAGFLLLGFENLLRVGKFAFLGE